MESKETLKKIKEALTDNRILNSWAKEPLIELIDKALDLTPSSVNSPFTRDELECMVKYLSPNYGIDNDLRNSIFAKIDHLLTAPLEWPQMMLTGDWECGLVERNVIYADPMNRFFVTKDESDREYFTWKHARPIPKEKTLADLVKGDNVWAIDVCLMFDNKTEALCFGSEYVVQSVVGTVVYFDTKHRKNHGFQKDELHEFFQLTPPTPAQIEAAEAAEIKAVKEKYELMKKEVKGGN